MLENDGTNIIQSLKIPFRAFALNVTSNEFGSEMRNNCPQSLKHSDPKTKESPRHSNVWRKLQ